MARALHCVPGVYLFSTIDTLRRSLDFHLERHNVLSSNVANVDTPGFRPLELVRAETTADGTRPLATTNAAHFPTSTGLAAGETEVREDRVGTVGADGNSVSLEREMAKLAANDLRFDGGVKIVSARLALLKYAANDANGGG